MATLIVDVGAEHDLRRALRGHGRSGRRPRARHRHPRGPIREDHGFAQEALRERCHQRRRRHHVLQAYALESMETRSLVGELARPTDRQVPRAWPGADRIAPCPAASLRPPSTVVKSLTLTKIFHELRGQIAGHSSFPVARDFQWIKGRHCGPSRRRCTQLPASLTVIDLKCDSCTKPLPATAAQINFSNRYLAGGNKRALCSEINACRLTAARSRHQFYFCHVRRLTLRSFR